MRKQLLKISVMLLFAASTTGVFAQRYVNEVFTDALKTANIEYDTNRSLNLLFGQIPNQQPFITASLKCDIYYPAGDTASKRPVIIVTHTGSYLPPIVNRQTTGSKDDSSIVELCTKFAKRGYVAVAMNYRLGWNAASTIKDTATGDLLRATYRAIQDVRNCVRFLRLNAGAYKIDTSKIVVGGQGTGGYIALGFGTVDKQSEIELPKFLRSADLSPMVDVNMMGDWFGLGGNPFVNYSGDSAVSSKAHMIFNYGGALGDSSWLNANSLPVVSLQCVSDPFAPYGIGNVVVPTTQVTVITNASGASTTLPRANALGVNNTINARTYSDPISNRAMSINGGQQNFFPFITPTAESAPWEWWDRTAMQAISSVNIGGIPIPASGRVADSLSMLVNPTMSAAKGKAYVDTIVRYLAPRIAQQLNLYNLTGISEKAIIRSTDVSVYPNPAQTNVTVKVSNVANLQVVKVYDLTGREVLTVNASGKNEITIDNQLKGGVYFMEVYTDKGKVARKLIIE
jgi:acetyl esterase/lipase